MSKILALISALVAEAGSQSASEGAVRIRDVELETDGAKLKAGLDHPLARGDLGLSVHVDAESASRYVVRIALTELPKDLAPRLAPFRDVIGSARTAVELDFGG
jgi:hypothetical protein